MNWTVGQEVTIEGRKFGSVPTYTHCKIARVTKTSVTTDTEQRFTLRGSLWGSDAYSRILLFDRPAGLEREAAGAEKRKMALLCAGIHNLADQLVRLTGDDQLDRPRAREIVSKLAALLEDET